MIGGGERLNPEDGGKGRRSNFKTVVFEDGKRGIANEGFENGGVGLGRGGKRNQFKVLSFYV